jgi:DNA-binding MarR family transcriptional regulator
MKRATTGAAEARHEEEVDTFRLEEFVPFRLAVAAGRLSRLFARRFADGFGVTLPEWRVLAVVGQEQGISPSRVAERTGMDKVKVSRAAAALVGRGLLRQTADPVDGRARVLRLTRKGERTLSGLIPAARATEAELQEGLGRSEWAQLERTLRKLGARLDELAVEGSEEGPD